MAEEEKQAEFEIPDLEEEGTEQVSFNTVDLYEPGEGSDTKLYNRTFRMTYD